ncbi:hypothetical protein [Maricaulis sp.]|uniref:hypothetical protein n=1 Tax=Maricaulis sp. TaxID=1486257 RepID=UPI002B26ED18|nr:hypothetical protein [Maricaulis sp.]
MRINRVLFALALILFAITLYRYSSGAWYTVGYRTGLLSLDRLPEHMQDWLPATPLWQDAIYLGGYFGTLASIVLLVMRRSIVVWVYLIAGGLGRLDWALLPFSPAPMALFLGWTAFLQYAVLVGLMVALNRRGFFR